jgi:ABC-type Fe3+-citrate transport system substrate-binding protein
MKTHIFFLTLLAVLVTACASKENTTAYEKNQQKDDHYSFIDGQASRFR